MLRAKDLSRSYGSFRAVDTVSFEIDKGEIVGLLGHNGAGKSTIMKMLTGYLEADAGSVALDNFDITKDKLEIQKRVGYLPENSPTYPDMSVVDYLFFVGRMRGLSDGALSAAVKQVIQRTSLGEKTHQRIDTLSRGFKQRVGVAQAILHEPEILILDEPTNGLDPSQILEMRKLIKELSQNCTVILSTHILQEVEALCDRVIVIVRGKLALDAKLSDLHASDSLLVETDEASNTRDLVLDVGTQTSFEALPSRPGRTRFRVSDKKQGSEVLAPALVKNLVQAGRQVYSLQPEQKNLETVFRELNN